MPHGLRTAFSLYLSMCGFCFGFCLVCGFGVFFEMLGFFAGWGNDIKQPSGLQVERSHSNAINPMFSKIF